MDPADPRDGSVAGQTPRVLQPDAVARAAAEGALPPRWRMRAGRGRLVLVSREGACVPGVLGVVPRSGSATLRRVLARRGDEVLLRALAAPRADGWFPSSVVMGVSTRAVHAPELHAAAAWWAALAVAHARALTGRLAHRPRVERPEVQVVAVDDPRVRALDATRAARGDLPTGRAVRSPAGEPLVLIAVEAGRPIGGVRLAWPAAGECYSHTMWIAPEARGRGLGLALKRAVLEEARRRGATRARCHVHARNVRSLRLNARLGWRWTGRWLEIDGDPFAAMDLQLKELVIDLVGEGCAVGGPR